MYIDLHQKINTIPSFLYEEVAKYIDFLLYTHKQNESPKVVQLSFSWEGGLENIQTKFTSVGLQHKALEYR